MFVATFARTWDRSATHRLATVATECPRGAARSARHPVTVEIVGSNPIEDAFGKLEARNPKLEKKSDVLVEQRSARDPAKVEIVGSNPTGDSLLKIRNPKNCGTVRERA